MWRAAASSRMVGAKPCSARRSSRDCRTLICLGVGVQKRIVAGGRFFLVPARPVFVREFGGVVEAENAPDFVEPFRVEVLLLAGLGKGFGKGGLAVLVEADLCFEAAERGFGEFFLEGKFPPFLIGGEQQERVEAGELAGVVGVGKGFLEGGAEQFIGGLELACCGRQEFDDGTGGCSAFLISRWEPALHWSRLLRPVTSSGAM